MAIIKKYTQQFRDFKLSTKFVAALCGILIVLTIIDITYNAARERRITQQAVNNWTFLLAENVRDSLNTLMREGRMNMRFALFDNLAKDGGGYLVYLASSRVNLQLTEERWPDITFSATREL